MASVDDVKRLREITEQEVLLLDELARRGVDDPLKLFVPHPKQKAFIEAVLHGPRDENWMFAANRSGKTDGGAAAGATLARFGDQGDDVKFVGASGSAVQIRDRATSGWVSSVDFSTSRDVVEPKYFNNGFVPPGATHQPFIPDREIEHWGAQDRVLRLKNGSIIGFKSADSGRSKYQGTEKDWVHLDEEHPRDIYHEVKIRVGARKLRLFGTATLLPPLGQVGGVTWMFEDVIKPWQRGALRTLDIFGASIYDNPHLHPEEIIKLEALFPEGSIERRIRLNGELLPGMAGARAYGNYEYALHVFQQPDIVLRRPLCWIWDFNVEPMVSLIGQRERLREGRYIYRIYKELLLDGSPSIPDMCEMFYQFHPRHQAELWIYGDSTSKGRSRQTGKSDYTLILNEMRQYGVPVRLKVPDSNPHVPDRVNAVNRVLRDEDGEIRLFIDTSCAELQNDLEQVLRDARGGIKKVYNQRDPYFRRTHMSDALGYWISYDEPVQQMRPEATEKVKIISPSYGFQGSGRTLTS